MKNIHRHLLLLSLSAAMIWSCEDEVSVDLGEPESLFTVDAWLDNQQDTQRIVLTRSTDFFNNETLPSGVTGASVIVEDENGNQFSFVDQGDGNYFWISPVEGQGFGEVGTRYDLTIQSQGTIYSSTTLMKPTTVVDSVYFKEEDDAFEGTFIRADFLATDLETFDDTYWIKSYVNDTLHNKVSEINIAYDAGFTEGGGDDQNGKTFIPPIRFGINDFDEIPIYEEGDVIRVEIHSISIEAFNFLNLLTFQSDREAGLDAIFESPLSNVNTNIISSNANEQVMGIFNVAAVAVGEKELILEEVVPLD